MKISFRYVAATGNPNDGTYRVSYWVNDETGVELHKGHDIGETPGSPVIEWQVWTAGMGKPLACGCPNLSDAKAMARHIITERKEWLA